MSTIITAGDFELAAEIASLDPLEVKPSDAERLRVCINLGAEAVKSPHLDGIGRVVTLAQVLRLRNALESIAPTA